MPVYNVGELIKELPPDDRAAVTAYAKETVNRCLGASGMAR